MNRSSQGVKDRQRDAAVIRTLKTQAGRLIEWIGIIPQHAKRFGYDILIAGGIGCILELKRDIVQIEITLTVAAIEHDPCVEIRRITDDKRIAEMDPVPGQS